MVREEILVLGLGRFGRALARTLLELGHEVMGLDADAETVQAATRDLPHVVQVDATDVDAMRELGVNDFETADRKSTRLNSSHIQKSRMPSSA